MLADSRDATLCDTRVSYTRQHVLFLLARVLLTHAHAHAHTENKLLQASRGQHVWSSPLAQVTATNHACITRDRKTVSRTSFTTIPRSCFSLQLWMNSTFRELMRRQGDMITRWGQKHGKKSGHERLGMPLSSNSVLLLSSSTTSAAGRAQQGKGPLIAHMQSESLWTRWTQGALRTTAIPQVPVFYSTHTSPQRTMVGFCACISATGKSCEEATRRDQLLLFRRASR